MDAAEVGTDEKRIGGALWWKEKRGEGEERVVVGEVGDRKSFFID